MISIAEDDEAMDIPLLFGRFLVHRGYASEQELAAAVHVRAESRSCSPALDVAAQLSCEQLAAARALQRARPDSAGGGRCARAVGPGRRAAFGTTCAHRRDPGPSRRADLGPARGGAGGVSTASSRRGIVKRRLAPTFALACAAAAAAWPGVAAERHGIAAVLIVDTSGSMKKSDPLMIRRAAVQLFVSLLDAQDTVAITGFDDDARVLAAAVALDTASRRRLLAAAGRITSKGAHTNLHTALDEGLELLQTIPDRGERRMLILLTDGIMDSGDATRDAAYAAELRGAFAARCRNRRVKVHTLAFTEASDRALLAEVAAATGGNFEIAETDADLPPVFARLFEKVKLPESLPVRDSAFEVDPSVQRFTVYLQKRSDVQAELHTPGGVRQTAARHEAKTDWLETPQFAVATVAQPEPGTWRATADAPGAERVYAAADTPLLVAVSPARVAAGEPVRVESRFERDGRPFLPAAPIEISAVLDDGTVAPGAAIALNDEGRDGDRTAADLVYTATVTPAVAGRAVLKVTAHASGLSRARSVTLQVDAPRRVAPARPSPPPSPLAAESPPLPPAESPTKARLAPAGPLHGMIVDLLLLNALFAVLIGAVLAIWYLRRARNR
jgi:Mg-chelatase subunit ChlD